MFLDLENFDEFGHIRSVSMATAGTNQGMCQTVALPGIRCDGVIVQIYAPARVRSMRWGKRGDYSDPKLKFTREYLDLNLNLPSRSIPGKTPGIFRSLASVAAQRSIDLWAATGSNVPKTMKTGGRP